MKYGKGTRGFCAILSALLLLSACTGTGETETVAQPEDSAQIETTADTIPAAEESAETESALPFQPAIGSEIDGDADSVEGIAIRSAEELMKIGKDKNYPLDGDYVLVADIDLSGIDFTPIGGAESESGIVKGKNVFSGTFDGRGHIIVNLSMDQSSSSRIHVGLFGSVGSADKNDPAEIKNLIIKDAEVKGTTRGVACYAVLCGQCAGYVDLDNIALMSGTVEATYGGGDLLGAGALIGECRTDSSTKLTNKPIHISNIFSSVAVTGENDSRSAYTSGIIGRIRGSDLGTMKNVVMLGTVTLEGAAGMGNAIAGGDSGIKTTTNVYYLYGAAQERRGLSEAKTYEELSGGSLKLADGWHVEAGLYPMPEMLYACPYVSMLDFLTLSLENGESADKVQSDFMLPVEVMGHPVRWTSDREDLIRIEGNIARVTKPAFGSERVLLTAEADGTAKTYALSVYSGVRGMIVRNGDNLIPKNYPENVEFTWTTQNLANGKTQNKTGASLPVPSKDGTLVTLKAEGYEEAYYLTSSLPTVYVTSDSGYYDISRNYARASMIVQTTEKFPTTAYDGDISIKLRGNSTAGARKRPFKIKLDEKSDLFGMGANKHWCLLANYYDRTNLRNKVSYDFSMELGLVGCASEMVNLVYNGEYCGLYELTESIRVDEDRVDIFDWEEEAENVAKAIYKKDELSKAERDALEDAMTRDLSWITTGVFGDYNLADYYDTSAWDITGGYLIEDDDYFDEVSKFRTENDMKLMLHKPEFLATNPEMMEYLQTYVQNTEDAIYAPNRLSAEGLHYSEYMDVDSFVDFWVVNTLFKNVELLYKSCYFYKPVGGTLIWGPVWDMDWTSANHVNLDKTSAAYDSWKHGQSQDREYWYRALYNDPWFIVQLCERWGEIGDKIDGMFAHYDELSEEIRDAAELDNSRWNYDWKYSREVSTLRTWLENRRAWMDEQMKDPATLIESLGYYKRSDKIAVGEVKDAGDRWEITLKVADSAGIASADVLLNGRIIRSDIEVKDGEVITVEKSECREAGLYNALEILTKDAKGSYNAITRRSGENGSNANEGCYCYFR